MEIKKITIENKEYPLVLKEIHNPPKELYIKGEIVNQDKVAVAIVGTRRYSQYGKQVCLDIAGKLAKLGFRLFPGWQKALIHSRIRQLWKITAGQLRFWEAEWTRKALLLRVIMN